MSVELRKEEEVFETKNCCILCKMICPNIPMATLLKILNSTECQSVLSSFRNIKAICTNPDVIINVTKRNQHLSKSYDLSILKYLSLLSS